MFAEAMVNHHTFFKTFMMHVSMCLIALVYLYLYEKKGLKTLAKRPLGLLKLGTNTVLAQLIMTFSMILWTSVIQELWKIDAQPALYFNSVSHFLLFGLLQVTGLAAIREELLFRGIFQRLLCEITQSCILSTCISALAFSLMHGNIANMPLYFSTGCFFSYLYQQTDHIIYPIIAHAIHNLCVVSIAYFQAEAIFNPFVYGLPILPRIVLAIGCLMTAYFYASQTMKQKPAKLKDKNSLS
ncbi:CPBP family intramembrane glutamic endopeptidase [Cardinium endosymbiont of Tipula unca]|uniref:CPBP family intramembrane glutamic endopeptidase n=1 Tax=Cardinium endosymbiont of Tipula unca TaxID=3066216 RepID=UPI0030CBAD95